MNSIGTSGTISIWDVHGQFATMVWLRIWLVTFVTSLPMDRNGEIASLVMWSWVSLPFATGVAATMAYAAGDRPQKAQDSSTS